MYNFALQKDMDTMLDDFDHFCQNIERINLIGMEGELVKYDCSSELNIIIYYLDGKAVAYIDKEDTLTILNDFYFYSEHDKISPIKHLADVVFNILEAITYNAYSNNKKLYIIFEGNHTYLSNDINRIMYWTHTYEKEKDDFDTEDDDNKLWQSELAKQADACNKGIL